MTTLLQKRKTKKEALSKRLKNAKNIKSVIKTPSVKVEAKQVEPTPLPAVIDAIVKPIKKLSAWDKLQIDVGMRVK